MSDLDHHRDHDILPASPDQGKRPVKIEDCSPKRATWKPGIHNLNRVRHSTFTVNLLGYTKNQVLTRHLTLTTSLRRITSLRYTRHAPVRSGPLFRGPTKFRGPTSFLCRSKKRGTPSSCKQTGSKSPRTVTAEQLSTNSGHADFVESPCQRN